MQIFNKDQLHYVNKGSIHQKTLKNQIQEALHSNAFNSNYIVSGKPGLGKSFEMAAALNIMKDPRILKFEGSATMAAFTIDIATAVFLAGKKRITVVLDDCDMLFEDKNVNTAKKMFDDTRALKYTKMYTALRGFCTELQFEAIQSFASDDKAGFSVPLDNLTFIILTNISLPTINEVEGANAGSARQAKLTDLYSIRRRTEYKEIEMNDNELWGYVANVVINEHICEKWKPSISNDEKNQILTWCFSNWSKVTERNLSLVEKMTRDIVRYPADYLDIWTTNYL